MHVDQRLSDVKTVAALKPTGKIQFQKQEKIATEQCFQRITIFFNASQLKIRSIVQGDLITVDLLWFIFL